MLAFAFLVLLRILKKSLERASQEGAEKTTEMKERIKAKIDLVDMVRNSPLVCLLWNTINFNSSIRCWNLTVLQTNL